MKQLKRVLLLAAGFVFVALGIVGFFLPVMPSIPFFIIASICFSKSSKKFHDMLMNNRWVGPRIQEYHQNNGIKVREKVFIIALQWTGVIFTSVFFVREFWGRILLLGIVLAGTLYILSLKTVK